MGREAEGDNVVLLAIYLEGVRQMTLVTVQNKHPPDALSSLVYILVEIFDPFQTRIIVCPTICRSSNRPGVWKAAVYILRQEMIFALDNQH